LRKLWKNDASQLPEGALMMTLIFFVLFYAAAFVGIQVDRIFIASAGKLVAP
jgi:hypothetical protein